MDSLMEEAIPGFSFAVFKWSIAVRFPFLEKHCGAVLATEVSTERLLKAAAKDHCGARLFLPPAIQIAVAIAARASQVLANLRVAIDHHCLPAHHCGPVMCNRVPPSQPRGRRHRGFGKSVRSGWYKRSGRR